MAYNWPQNQRPESRCHYLAVCKGLSTLSFPGPLVIIRWRTLLINIAQRFAAIPQNHLRKAGFWRKTVGSLPME